MQEHFEQTFGFENSLVKFADDDQVIVAKGLLFEGIQIESFAEVHLWELAFKLRLNQVFS